jgi:carboxypeptidase Q
VKISHLFLALSLLVAAPAAAQTFANDDPVLRQIWHEGMENSHAYAMSQALFDSIGPRLTGSPGHEAGNAWLVRTYQSLGIAAAAEPYGEWMRWRRGPTHIDLLEPRVRTLEGMMLAWSPGTGGRPVRGEVVTLPDVSSQNAFEAWLPQVSGKFVAISFPEPTCRPDDNWEEFATEDSFQKMQDERSLAEDAWDGRVEASGVRPQGLARRLEDAGAAGIIASRWSNGWGVQKIFAAGTERVPHVDVSCEDYGLLVRLAENGQHPVVEITAQSEFLGTGPVSNVIARIPGTELPNQYVMMSAHFDSWDGGSGTTDNGTGTITMLEAMRILKTVYPNPKRTILVGHWGGEEQGLIGSRSYMQAHPEVVEGLQALFNQDNGTGRIVNLSSQGLTEAAGEYARWLSLVPSEMTNEVRFQFPGMASGGGSDNASFICAGAPAFSLGALNWSYGTYTWHTQRDTFDKIVFDDLMNNATMTAMLVYLASEDDDMVPRVRRTAFPSRQGRMLSWPECQAPRTWEEYRAR